MAFVGLPIHDLGYPSFPPSLPDAVVAPLWLPRWWVVRGAGEAGRRGGGGGIRRRRTRGSHGGTDPSRRSAAGTSRHRVRPLGGEAEEGKIV